MFLKHIVGGLLLLAVLIPPAAAWAAHPLITDDADTQGLGKYQIEVNGQYDYDKETVNNISVKTTGGQAGASLSYGVIENADLVLNLPYVWSTVTEDGVSVYDEKGLSDILFEVKWRFIEKNGFSFGLKPGISLPTGNDNKGLGAGKTGYQLFLIGSKEVASWAFHANLGIIGNELINADEQKNIWHASLATTYEVTKELKVVGNIGIEKSSDKTADNDAAFLLGGVIYSLTDNFDVDAGVKSRARLAETDWSVLAGTAFRF